MKTIIAAIGLILLLGACAQKTGQSEMNNDSATAVPPTQESDAAPGMGMGRMGMGGGMMARHHAAVPQEYAGLINPVPADEESLARGGELYTQYCASCHGDGGMGDGPAGEKLDPLPAPVAHTSRMLGDDYLFWRISEGGAHDPFKSAMPAWEGAIDDEARWDLVNYLRALGSGSVMPGGMMGGARFDPAAEAAQHAEMLATAVSQSLITETEAETFDLVHAAMDEWMAGNPPGMRGGMSQMQERILNELVETSQITQAQADSFNKVHDLLLEAGLMQ